MCRSDLLDSFGIKHADLGLHELSEPDSALSVDIDKSWIGVSCWDRIFDELPCFRIKPRNVVAILVCIPQVPGFGVANPTVRCRIGRRRLVDLDRPLPDFH